MDINHIKHKHIQREVTKVVFREVEKDLVNLPIEDERVHPHPKQHKILQSVRKTRVPKIHLQQLRSHLAACSHLKASGI